MTQEALVEHVANKLVGKKKHFTFYGTETVYYEEEIEAYTEEEAYDIWNTMELIPSDSNYFETTEVVSHDKNEDEL